MTTKYFVTQLPGELSHYLVSGQTVKQVKTNRMTGSNIITDISHKPKAKKVIEWAARENR